MKIGSRVFLRRAETRFLHRDQRLADSYDRFAPALFRYALILLANHHEAEDAIQQTFVGLAKRGFRGIDSIEAYLRTSVRNECYSALGRRRHEATHVNGEPLLESAPSVSVPHDERLIVEAALRTVPPEQREVVHLKVFEGRTFQEIADLTGESINTIASRYRYAVEKLRATLAPERTP